MLRSGGGTHIPCDFGIYDKAGDGKTGNGHFSGMLSEAEARGSGPECVLSGSWYAGPDNLKMIRDSGRFRLTRLKPDRPVNPDGCGNVSLSSADISEKGTTVRLKGYGFVKVSGIAGKNGGTGYRAADNPETDGLLRLRFADFSWKTGEYRRGLRQFCGVERCQCRTAKIQRNHTGLSIRTFPRSEIFSLRTGLSRFESRNLIIREAVRAYIANPIYDF